MNELGEELLPTPNRFKPSSRIWYAIDIKSHQLEQQEASNKASNEDPSHIQRTNIDNPTSDPNINDTSSSYVPSSCIYNPRLD
ncbi:hypothetical protein MFRU_003g03900 [Monilinia fructicola]|nr:hypothetical protein MFRU_003g03900 [Monilinia fructicola]